MRVVKLKLLTQEGLVVVNTEALTFGDFKNEPEVKKLEINWSNAKLIDRASKASFDLDESRLPEIDSIMFVTPIRTKAGILSYSEAKARVKELIAEGKIEAISWMGKTTGDLNRIIYDYDITKDVSKIAASSNTVNTDSEAAIIVQEIEKLLEEVNKGVKRLSKVAGGDSTSLIKELTAFKENLAEFTTKERLSIEAEELALRF